MKKTQGTVFDRRVGALSSVSVTVYNQGTTNKPTIYSDNGITPQANPFQTDSLGRWAFYVAYGHYDIEFSGSTINTYKLEDIYVHDPDLYALLTGRAGGQTLIGGAGVTDILKLQGTSGNGTLTSPAIQLLVGNAGGTVAMTVLNNGKVGIGTATPDGCLHLKGTTPVIKLENTGVDTGRLGIDGGGIFIAADTATKKISFYVNNGTGLYEFAKILPEGQLRLDLTINHDPFLIVETIPNTADTFDLIPFEDDETAVLVGVRNAADTQWRFYVDKTGILHWGPSTGGPDVSMFRAGIGTLEVSGGGNINIRINGGADGSPHLDLYQEAAQRAYLQYLASGDYVRLVDNGTVGIIQKSGKIGIGMVPTYNLDITGNLRCSTGFGCNGTIPQTAYVSGGALAAYVTGAFGLDSAANMSALHALVVKIRAALVANGIMS